MGFDRLKDKARIKKDALGEKAAELKEAASDLGMEKVQQFVEAFNTALPLIENGGYRLVEIDITMGVPPRFAPAFQLARAVSEEEQAVNLAAVAEHKRAHMMLSTLYKTSAIQSQLAIGGLRPHIIVMELGGSPKTRIKYIDDRRADLVGAAEDA